MTWRVFITCAMAACGGLLFGYDLGKHSQPAGFSQEAHLMSLPYSSSHFLELHRSQNVDSLARQVSLEV